MKNVRIYRYNEKNGNDEQNEMIKNRNNEKLCKTFEKTKIKIKIINLINK